MPLFSGLWLGAAVFALLYYFAPAVQSVLFNLSLALIVFSACWAAGRRLLARTDLGVFSAPAALTLGLAVLTLGVTFLGFAQLLYPAAVAILLGVMLWQGRGVMGFSSDDLRRHLSGKMLYLLPSALFALAVFIACFAPVHQYDSLVYHMALPQIYAAVHHIARVPFNLYSNFPQYGEMLFSVGVLFCSDTLAQLFSWFAYAVGGLWVYCACLSIGTAGWLALFLTLSHTALMLLSCSTYVETLTALWITAAVLSFGQWIYSENETARPYFAALAGIACGMAFGTKYYAGVTAAILFVMGVLHIFSAGWFSVRKRRALELLMFAGLAFVLYLPWAIKNMAWAGNPVYPFFYGFFNAGGPAAEQAKNYFAVLTEYRLQGHFFRELISMPLFTFLTPGRYGGGMDVLGSLGWELVLVGIPFMIYSALSGGIRRFVGVYLALHAVVWLSTGCVLRFLTVTVGLAAILAADGIIKYWREAPRYARIMLASGLVLFAGARLLSYAYVQNVFEIPSVLTSVRTPRQYLSSRLSYYPCAEAAGKLTPPDSRILLAGEMRSYYFGRIVWPTSIFRPNEFVAMANASSGYEDYRQKLLAFGYTHVITVPQELRRLQSYRTLEFDRNGYSNWNALQQNAKKEFESSGCALYSLQ